jgi:hypothetical protein
MGEEEEEGDRIKLGVGKRGMRVRADGSEGLGVGDEEGDGSKEGGM